MTKELKAQCCICEKEFPESQGSWSIQYDESGAFFICSECAKEERRIYDRFADGEIFEDEDNEELYHEGDYS